MREVIAEAVERIADGDERIGFITVSSVECSPDLRHADVLFSSLTDEVAALLDERRIEIQKLLSSCLLYTSPSPRDRTRSRMPSSA